MNRLITRIESLPNSNSGNPRYRIGFDDATSAITSSDAAFCYAVGNPGMRVGSYVRVQFTPAGRIAHMEVDNRRLPDCPRCGAEPQGYPDEGFDPDPQTWCCCWEEPNENAPHMSPVSEADRKAAERVANAWREASAA